MLEGGHVVKRGTHVALLPAAGLDAEMWNLETPERAEEEGTLATE